MPEYDAFGRPLSGDVTFTTGPPTVVRRSRRVLGRAVVVLVVAALGAIRLGVALYHPPEPSPLQWLATFRGYHGDVRADGDGAHPEVHPYS